MFLGILSVYGGTYQMQGVSWHDFGANPNRDMTIISRGHEIKPIEMTANEFNTKKYDFILVKVTNPLYLQDKTASKYKLAYGGVHEVDSYNEKYPFYCSTNKQVFFGGADSASGEIVRLTQDQDVLLTYGVESSLSYKFYIGGTCYYYPNHAEYIGQNNAAVENTKQGKYVHDVMKEDGTIETVTDEIDKTLLVTTVYKAKIGIFSGISGWYVPTSGNVNTSCYQITIASPADVTFTGEQA